MKRVLLGVIITLFGFCIFNDRFIYEFFNGSIRYNGNSYFLNNDYVRFKNNDDLIAYDKDDIVNIIYTFINKGTENFSFYCYYDCKSDIDILMNDKDNILYINDFIHPYNSFKNIHLIYRNKIIYASVTKKYSYDDINVLNNTVNNIISSNITSDMSTKEMIQSLHDYLILNTSYDKDYEENLKKGVITNSASDSAIGALIEKKAVCSGYTDALAIMLNHLNIKNIKISNENHIWNLVNINDQWFHLDVTGDDLGNDINKRFFLVNDDTIRYDNKHNYDSLIYSEFIK